MPIKLPRFRRKSVGNSLEATYQAAEPESPGGPRGNQANQANLGNQFSFDEIERPSPQNRKNFPQYPQPQYQQQAYSSHLKYGDSTGSSSASRSNSNSGGSTGTGYYASDRQSSSSTLPSSAEIPRTPPSAEDPYRSGLADNMSLKDSMAYGSSGQPVSRGGWQNSKVGSTNMPSTGGFRGLTEPPRLETSLDSEPLFGDDMFKFTSDGKRMSSIGLLDTVGPKVATSLFVPNSKETPIAPVPPVPPPKSIKSTTTQSRRLLDSRIHGDDEDIYPSSSAPRYQGAPSIPSPIAGNSRPSPSAKDGVYPWEARQDDEQDSLMSGERSPLPPPLPKKDTFVPRHNRTLTPSTSPPAKLAPVESSLATPPRTQRAPKPASGTESGLKRTGMSKRPTTRGSTGSQEEPKPSPPSILKRKEVPKAQESPAPNSIPTSSPPSTSLPPIPTTTVTSPPRLPRVQTSPAIISQDTLFSDSESQRSTPKAKSLMPIRSESDDFLSSALARDAAIASSFEVGETHRLNQPRKVFTKAQFERYKAQQEEERQYQAKNGRNEDSDSESNLSDDDQDETERQKAQAKQRAKQDAHLSVYRQQMMKITGSHANESNNLGMSQRQASNSTPMLSLPQMPHLSISSPSSAGEKSDEEDEEVPLGILMAHGFPSKQSGRPPTRLSNSNSSPNLRSVSGTTQFEENSSSTKLPPFARNLPADPYFGASLVNQANRVSMAPSSIYGGRESVHQGPPQPRPVPQQRYPTGLIGNIVRDEELRAARRGGPQHVPAYSEAQTSSASEAVQMQMANQMTQMMQIQMQWMQQMSQMNQQPQQSMGGMPGMGMPGMGMLGMNNMGMMNRNSLMPNMMMPGQRSMSMVDTGSMPHFQPGPGMMGQQPGGGLNPGYAGSVYGHNRSSTMPGMFMQPGYTPSIAPSERSNIGQPSRYRPVTYQAGSGNSSVGGGGRTGTMTSGVPPFGLKSQMAKKDDSDDEDGWAEMDKKKKEKKETWKKKKESGGLKSVLKLGGGSSTQKNEDTSFSTSLASFM